MQAMLTSFTQMQAFLGLQKLSETSNFSLTVAFRRLAALLIYLVSSTYYMHTYWTALFIFDS